MDKIPKKIAEIAKTAAKVILESIYVTAFASQPNADSATKPLNTVGVNSSLVFMYNVNKRTADSRPIPGSAQAWAIPPLKMPFMAIQVLAIVLLYTFPAIGLWLPHTLYK